MSITIVWGPPGDSLKSRFFHETVVEVPFEQRARILYIVSSSRKRRQILREGFHAGEGIMPRILRFGTLFELLYHRLGGTRHIISEAAATYLILYLLRYRKIKSAPPATGGLALELTRHIKALEIAGMSSEDIAAMPDAGDGYGTFFFGVFRQYEKKLTEISLMDPWQSPRIVNNLLSGFPPERLFTSYLEWNRLVVDGFIDFTPPQLDLIRFLSRGMDVMILWPGVPEGFFQPAVSVLKAAFPDAEWVRNQGISPDSESRHIRVSAVFSRCFDKPEQFGFKMDVGGNSEVCVIEAESVREEVKTIARDIKRRLLKTDKTLQPGRIAVVFPDMETYAPLVRRIFKRYGLPVNIGKPLPFTGSPVFRMMMRILEVPPFYHRRTLLSLLSEPLLKVFPYRTSRESARILDAVSRHLKIVQGKEIWMEKIESHMSSGVPEVSPDDLRWLKESMEKLFSVLEPLEYPATPREHMRHLRNILDAFDVPGCLENISRLNMTPSGREESAGYLIRSYGALIRYFDEMEIMWPYIKNETTCDIDAFRRMLPRLFSGVTYQLATLEGDRIQVLGLREVRGLTFTHLYIGGLNEETFPGREPPSPFWNIQVWEELLGIPQRYNRYLAASDIYRALLVPEKDLILTRPRREGETELLPSPAWTRLLACYSDIKPLMTDTGTAFCLSELMVRSGSTFAKKEYPALCRDEAFYNMVNGIRFSLLNRSDFDEPGRLVSMPGLLRRLRSRAGTSRPLSVSAIQHYIDCPRRFFLAVILELAPVEEPAPDPAPWDMGIWLHDVFNRFYRERIEKGLGRVGKSEWDQSRKRLIEIARETARELALDNLYMTIFLDAFAGDPTQPESGISGRFLQQETSVDMPLNPVLVEYSFGRSDTPAVCFNPSVDMTRHVPVTVSGRIDRIDAMEGTFVIYDYKSGNVPSGAELEKGDVVQMWVYAAAMERIFGKLPDAALYYRISFGKGCRMEKGIGMEHTRAGNMLKDLCGKGALLYTEEAFKERVGLIRKKIMEIAACIRNGIFPVVEDIKRCRGCIYADLCRRVVEGEDGN